MTSKQMHELHKQLLQNSRHLRYMWLPHTVSVLVVTCNAYVEVITVSPENEIAFQKICCSIV